MYIYCILNSAYYTVPCILYILYSGKFWIGANFCILCIKLHCTKMKLWKCLHSKYQILNRQSLMWYVDMVMALYRYFQSLLSSTHGEPSGTRHTANNEHMDEIFLRMWPMTIMSYTKATAKGSTLFPYFNGGPKISK